MKIVKSRKSRKHDKKPIQLVMFSDPAKLHLNFTKPIACRLPQ